jgi:hypothetical protein
MLFFLHKKLNFNLMLLYVRKKVWAIQNVFNALFTRHRLHAFGYV